MSVVGNQRQTFLRLASRLQPHWRALDFPQRLQSLLAAGRAFGSRDRRLYRELLYTVSRYLPWIEPLLQADPERAADVTAWLAADVPATRAYRAALGPAWPPCPGDLTARAAYLEQRVTELFPAWFAGECPEALSPPECDALLCRAPLWLRLQTDRPEIVAAEFGRRGWVWRESAVLPGAWELRSEADVTQSEAYAGGLIEIQDLGSQLLLASVDLPRTGRWLDACAGAGGKTLQLARILRPTGHVDAHDIRSAALAELGRRAARAGLDNVTVLPTAPAGLYDGVLVDAPCSGSGTWRRAPHLKWAVGAADLTEHAARQTALLNRYSRHVCPGGLLIYATCSLARRENEDVVARFLQQDPGFSLLPTALDFGFGQSGPGLRIRPARHDTDGFYCAVLRRG